jgi:hypothetical protein
VEVAGAAFSGKIAIVTVLLSCAFTDVGDVLVMVEVAHNGNLLHARGGAVGRRVEPAVFEPGHQCKGKHF